MYFYVSLGREIAGRVDCYLSQRPFFRYTPTSSSEQPQEVAGAPYRKLRRETARMQALTMVGGVAVGAVDMCVA